MADHRAQAPPDIGKALNLPSYFDVPTTITYMNVLKVAADGTANPLDALALAA